MMQRTIEKSNKKKRRDSADSGNSDNFAGDTDTDTDADDDGDFFMIDSSNGEFFGPSLIRYNFGP